jgi:hypothetical protein
VRNLHTSDTLGSSGNFLGKLLKIETRFMDEKIPSVMPGCVRDLDVMCVPCKLSVIRNVATVGPL